MSQEGIEAPSSDKKHIFSIIKIGSRDFCFLQKYKIHNKKSITLGIMNRPS